MNAAQFALAAGEIPALLQAQGYIAKDPTTGVLDFVPTKFNDIAADSSLAAGVEAILVKYGVHTPDRVNKIIQFLPLLAAIVK